MKKILIFAFLFITTYSFAVVPIPSGKGKIKPTLPSSVKPPSPIYKTDNINFPLPTNKWFTSVLYNQYNKYSLRMYAYPQAFECNPESGQSKGLLIAYPKITYSTDNIYYGDGESSAYAYSNNIKVSLYNSVANDDYVGFDNAKLDGYGDFSATMKWEYSTNKWLKATIAQGCMFSYFETGSEGVASLEFPYSWETYGHIHLYKSDGTEIGYALDIDTGDSDRIILETRFNDGRSVFYGIFVPQGTSFKQCSLGDNFNRIFIVLPTGQKYFSVGLLPSINITGAIDDLEQYYKYAYNFIIDTKVSWNVSSNASSIYTTTDFKFSFNSKRTETSFVKDKTLFCLFPHQYKNLKNSPKSLNKTFENTLRGNLKLYLGSQFSTKINFKGIVPFFYNNDISSQAILKIKASLEEDKNIIIGNVSEQNTYYYGKNLAKVANLIPVSVNMNNTQAENILKFKLKNELITWFTYTGQSQKYFAYDSNLWGGLIGVPNGFGSEQYNDHNFHYGYFIYASAILAMYDKEFANDYGGIVELLIKDFANTNRDDESFPYMRSYDFYESHSWANGMGGQDNRGIDLESSSEAMNAWAAIYMWGLATQKQEYIDLGIYLYTNEYEAIKNYFFDTDTIEKNILKSPYNHNSVGILWGGAVYYNPLHWTTVHGARECKGIQLLPMTSSMLYVDYDTTYAQQFYSQMKDETPGDYYWNDVWTKFESLFNPSQAWNDFVENPIIDDGGTKSYTYHFIDFFNQKGSLQNGYSSNFPAYIVTKKDDKINFSAYNYTDTVQKVDFYNSTGKYLGYINVYANSFMSTDKLLNGEEETTLSVFPVPYKPHSGGRYDGDGITFLGIEDGSNIKIFNVAGEKVFDKTISVDNKTFTWNAKNNYGNDVSSGVYIYIVTNNGNKIKGKLAIER